MTLDISATRRKHWGLGGYGIEICWCRLEVCGCEAEMGKKTLLVVCLTDIYAESKRSRIACVALAPATESGADSD